MPNHSNQAHMRKIAIFLFLLFATISGFSQGKSVQGKVSGENGNPLEGVTIQVRGKCQRLSNRQERRLFGACTCYRKTNYWYLRTWATKPTRWQQLLVQQ